MTRLPNALLSFYMGAIAVVIARKFGSIRPMPLLFAVLIGSAIGYFGILPFLRAGANLVSAAFHLTVPPEVHQMPYGIYVYKYIYGMFIEPTIASFLLIYLMWPSFTGSKLRRTALFVLLMLLIRGRVIATGFWIKDNAAMAFAAEAQFFVETFVLAALTGLTWAAVTPPVAGQFRD